jgi:hypothetical protein
MKGTIPVRQRCPPRGTGPPPCKGKKQHTHTHPPTQTHTHTHTTTDAAVDSLHQLLEPWDT